MPKSLKSQSSTGPNSRNTDRDRTPGAWVDWQTVEILCQQRLQRASQWQVLLAVLFTSARYGSRPAQLSIAEIAAMTGLGERTVQTNLTGLFTSGQVVREGRYRRLRVGLTVLGSADMVASPGESNSINRDADMRAFPKRMHECASPNSIYVSSYLDNEVDDPPTPFSSKQFQAVRSTMNEISMLIVDTDPFAITLGAAASSRLGMLNTDTFGDAYRRVIGSGDRKLAHSFVKSVLELKSEERIQGQEFEP